MKDPTNSDKQTRNENYTPNKIKKESSNGICGSQSEIDVVKALEVVLGEVSLSKHDRFPYIKNIVNTITTKANCDIIQVLIDIMVIRGLQMNCLNTINLATSLGIVSNLNSKFIQNIPLVPKKNQFPLEVLQKAKGHIILQMNENIFPSVLFKEKFGNIPNEKRSRFDLKHYFHCPIKAHNCATQLLNQLLTNPTVHPEYYESKIEEKSIQLRELNGKIFKGHFIWRLQVYKTGDLVVDMKEFV